MSAIKKLTPTQRCILENIAAGRSFDAGRPFTMSAAGGWDRSRVSCIQAGWLTPRSELTDEGRKQLANGGDAQEVSP